jgi:DNA polymerase I-like protein with 3'-5' exonuclease and polymerase domains
MSCPESDSPGSSTTRITDVEFPSLQGQGLIALDLETCDIELKQRGSGAHRGAHIAGVAIATEAGYRNYFPIGHECGENLPREQVLGWLRAELAQPGPKVGAHLAYDLGFLQEAGVTVAGPLWDALNAEPLLNENRFSYSLDELAKHYLKRTKRDTPMDAWLVEHFGKRNPRNHIWRAPPEIVRNYAIGDVEMPIEIFKRQRPLLEAQGLWSLFELESELIPLLVAMRRRGIRVDIDDAERLLTEFTARQRALEDKVHHDTGIVVEVWKAKNIAAIFDRLGIAYGRTKTGLPNIDKAMLAACEHPIAQEILEIRRLDKLRGTFLQGSILEAHHQGRVHTTFNQLRSDGGGTVSGRFSSTKPNLQFVSKHSEEGAKVRRLFLADEGQLLYKADYSQIEYRLIAHDAFTAGLPGADRVVEAYRSDPNVDYHQAVADMVGISRARAKAINFGLAYGMSAATLCRQLGVDREEGERILARYHERAPFIRPLAQGLSRQAEIRGEIRTLFNRRRRFPWVFTQNGRDVFTYGNRPPYSKRAFCYAALNARIQGSAADILKKAMVDIWKSGVCDVIGVPQLTVHDELVGSYPDTPAGREAVAHVKHLMENAVQLAVPLVVDAGVGKNWGDAK